MLSFLIFFPLVAACLIWVLCRKNSNVARVATLAAAVVELVVVASIWLFHPVTGWAYAYSASWIPSLGINYNLAMDGFSLVMILVTAFLGVIAVAVGWRTIDRWHVFGPLMLFMLTSLIGVFLAQDLMLFYIFWEVMLVPMYFMMSQWGGPKAKRAATRFLLFTVAASMLMLVGIVELYLIKAEANGGHLSFAFNALFDTPVKTGAVWITLAFLIGFGVKVPAFPLHLWAPEAYKESNPAVTILLSGAMANAGVYGILRICPFLSPASMSLFCEAGMALAAIGTIYTGLIAYRENNIRTVAAYSSVSHMNLAMLAIFALQLQAVNGAMVQLVAHAFSIAGIFAVVSMLEARGFKGELDAMGGLFKPMPRLGAFLLFFVVASIGMPGLGNFVAEILILAGSYQVSVAWTVLAAISIVVGVAYFLKMYERSMLGPLNKNVQVSALMDVNWREWCVLSALVFAILWLGVYPHSFTGNFSTAANQIVHVSQMSQGGL